jgi:hypothetical protein
MTTVFLTLFVVAVVFCWFMGAIITLKADAMISNCKTGYQMLPLALVSWPLFAFVIAITKHEIRHDANYRKSEFEW